MTSADAVSPRTNLHAAGHLGVKLPATSPPGGALDDEELFLHHQELEKSGHSGTQPLSGSPKNMPNPPPNRH